MRELRAAAAGVRGVCAWKKRRAGRAAAAGAAPAAAAAAPRGTCRLTLRSPFVHAACVVRWAPGGGGIVVVEFKT